MPWLSYIIRIWQAMRMRWGNAMTRTLLLLPLFPAVLVQSPAESCAAMESPAELRILHTADGQGEVFPCG